MRTSRIVTFAFVVFTPLFVFQLVAAQSEPAADWVSVAPDGSGFSVLMPAKPEVATEQSPIGANKYQTSTYTKADPNTGNVYLLVTQDLPNVTQTLTAARRMDEFVTGFKQGFGDGKTKVEMIYDRDLDLDGRYGRQYAFSYGARSGIVRAYDGGNRIYVLLAVGGDERNSGVARFLNSFKFTAPLPAAAASPPKPTR